MTGQSKRSTRRRCYWAWGLWGSFPVMTTRHTTALSLIHDVRWAPSVRYTGVCLVKPGLRGAIRLRLLGNIYSEKFQIKCPPRTMAATFDPKRARFHPFSSVCPCFFFKIKTETKSERAQQLDDRDQIERNARGQHPQYKTFEYIWIYFCQFLARYCDVNSSKNRERRGPKPRKNYPILCRL